jgi:hypothetical protein
MEALACKDGVNIAKDKNIRSLLLVETDSQELVKAWGDAELSKIMHFINHQIN